MSTPRPPPAQARNRILLPGIWVQGEYLSVLVTQRCDGKVEFAPNILGAPEMGADVSWFVRHWTPGEVHRGVFNQGMVQAACDLVFFPLRVEGQVCCHRLPQAEQVCPKCTPAMGAPSW